MNIRFSKSLWAASALFFVFNCAVAQKFTETFAGKYIYGWTFINNTDPQPYQSTTWRFGGTFSDPGPVGYANGADFFTTGQYEYAHVGYSKYDYDGANISNWFITPTIRNMKKGDIIKFITTAQPNISTLDNLVALYNMDINALADCNRPNNLEVRLSMDASDSVDVGRTADSFGTFTVQLLSINKNLSLNGYPQTWTEYTIKIEGDGVPSNETFDGKIAFWYHFPNGGFDNCQTRLNLPPATDLLFNFASSAPYIGDYAQYVKPAIQLAELAIGNQEGTNGTNIGVDDIQFIPDPGFFVAETKWGADRAKVWHANNQNNPEYTYLGYRGSVSCSDPNYKYPKERGLDVFNFTDNSITAVASVEGTSIGVKTSVDTINLAAGERTSMKLSLIPGNSFTNNIVYLKKLDGSILAKIRVAIRNEPNAPPIAKCSPFVESITIDNQGNSKPIDPEIVNLGSESLCGTTENLEYYLYVNKNFNWELITEVSCDELGENQVMLAVRDPLNGASAFCQAKLKVNIGTAPVFESGFTQTHTLSREEGNFFGMDFSKITQPSLVGGCDNATIRLVSIKDKLDRDIGKPDVIPAGEYTLRWAATDKAGNVGSKNTTLNVIDPIPPFSQCRRGTVNIGLTERIDGQTWLKNEITPLDIDGQQKDVWGVVYNTSWDNHKIKNYRIRADWNGNNTWSRSLPFDCDDAGQEFDIWFKVTDHFGNADSCSAHVKIADPAQATCRDVALDLDQKTGIAYIDADDILESAGDNACGISNTTVSRYSFNCDDVNKIIPVTATYTDAANVEHSCVANVTVNEYSSVLKCEDTVLVDAGENYFAANTDFGPQLSSVCSEQLDWTLDVAGTTYYNETNTGTINVSLNPGFNYVTRSTDYLDSTYVCNQVYHVVDHSAPTLREVRYIDNGDGTFTVDSIKWEDVLVQLPGLSQCTYPYTIIQPFELANTSSWSYTLSGATTGSQTFRYNFFGDNYSEDKTVNLNPGITTITLIGTDLVGNTTTFSFDFNLYIQSPELPLVYSEELQNTNVFEGDFCGEYYNYELESPFRAGCPNDDNEWMWYYEVRDSYNGNILFERDSISRDEGASIPLKVGPKFNQSYTNVIHLGYHTLSSGYKELSTYPTISVRDTLINEVICPNDISVDSYNDSTFTYEYEIEPPVGLCEGDFWGYSVVGASTASSTNTGADYNSNQTITLNNISIADAYPSLHSDTSIVVQLRIGTNIIKHRVLEESGNYDANNYCTHEVVVNDKTTPSMTCPPDVDIEHTSCSFALVGECETINGFTGPFGPSHIIQIHDNSEVILDKYDTPEAITFTSRASTPKGDDEVIGIKFLCYGPVSFDWEYQSDNPSAFRPFVLLNEYSPNAPSQRAISGFDYANTGIQTGTYSTTVYYGDILLIGMSEGGITSGHFKISNFSAPHSDYTAHVEAPDFEQSPLVYLKTDIDYLYEEGDHTINYELININNGSSVSCSQDISVVNIYSYPINCSEKKLNLDRDGIATLTAKDVINSCFPASSTTISKSTFGAEDIGVQTVTVESYSTTGNFSSCNIEVEVRDYVKPWLVKSKIRAKLDDNGNYYLSDATLYELFKDNDAVTAIGASRRQFDCSSGIGEFTVTVQGADDWGNVGTYDITIELYLNEFEESAIDVTETVCLGETKVFTPEIGQESNDYSYIWQQKDKEGDKQYWNFLASVPGLPLVFDASNYVFENIHQGQHRGSYMAYAHNNALKFKKFDPSTQTWKDALAPIAGNHLKLESTVLMDYNAQKDEPYVIYYTGAGDIGGKYYDNGNWTSIDINFIVKDYDDIKIGDDFIFGKRPNGQIYATRLNYSGTEIGVLYKLYDPINFDGAKALSLRNAGNLVAVRQSTNTNVFFELAYSNDLIYDKTQLTTDPTGNSAMYKMILFNNIPHIVYKAADGKVSVKKYDGSDSWSPVGSLGISTNEIKSFDLKSIGGVLHLTYTEMSDSVFIKKFENGNWVQLPSPHSNLRASEFPMTNISLVNVENNPVLFNSSNLIGLSNWKNLTFDDTYAITPPANFDEEYRYMAIKNSCAAQYSGVHRLKVNEVPALSVKEEVLIVGEGQAKLEAQGGPGTIKWTRDREANYLLGTGAELYTPYLDQHTTFYAYADNAPCYSDTLAVEVTVNDRVIKEHTLTYRDSVCKDEWNSFYINDPSPGFNYSLYQKLPGEDYELIDGPTSSPSVGHDATVTAQYRVKLTEQLNDAAQIATFYSKNLKEHHDFGQIALPIEEEVTVEVWVHSRNTSDPRELLCHVYTNGTGINDLGDTRNWEWTNGKFYVHNGSNTRQLSFPTLPGGDWTHVATTAGPNGLKIYYNGELVASSDETAEGNINANIASLTYGLKMDGIKGVYVSGLDEFRIWAYERSQAQINEQKDNCLTGNELGLLLYNNYNTYDEETFSFESVVGPKAVLKDIYWDSGFFPTRRRGGACGDEYASTQFLDPVTVYVQEGGATITKTNHFYPLTDTCGGEIVMPSAEATFGEISWYDAEIGGNYLGSGDTLKIFADSNMNVYAQPESACERWRAKVEINGYPEISNMRSNAICPGTGFYDANVNYDRNEHVTSVTFYDAPIGGNPIDAEYVSKPFFENDTLYAEATNNDYCIAEDRKQVIIEVIDMEINVSNDTSLCAPGSVILTASGIDGTIYWINEAYTEVLHQGNEFVTPVLSDTTTFNVAGVGSNGCSIPAKTVTVNVSNKARYETASACGAYVWSNGDGNTYYETNNDILYFKPNATGCDSVIHLDLTVVNVPIPTVTSGETHVCPGNATTITIQGSQAGFNYSIINRADNSVLYGPIEGTGADLVYDTGVLTDSLKYKVLIDKTTGVGGESLYCSEEVLGVINVGQTNSLRYATTCESYTWNGSTYKSSGIYNKTFTSALGCDSIATLNLTILGVSDYVDNVTACDAYTWHDSTYTQSTNTPTWTGISPWGCDSTATLNLTINYSSTVNSTVSACGQYTWLGNEYTNSGIYQRTLTTVAGCDSVVSINLTINGNDIDTNVTQTSSSLEAQMEGAAYQWKDCSTNEVVDTERLFIPEESGNYYVVISGPECADSSYCHYINPLLTDMGVGSDFSNVQVYPNPVLHNVIIEFSEIIEEGLISVKDLTGKDLFTKEVNNEKLIILNLDHLAEGPYAITLTEEGSSRLLRVIVKE